MALALAALTVIVAPATGQQVCERIMEQDSTLNNLSDPPGYRTAPLGSLGDVQQTGTGPGDMILIPGLGFSGRIFDEFMAAYGERFRMFAVTLPGFGGTAAPPSPPEGTSFGDQTWTTGALQAIEALIAREGIHDAVVVGHWLTGTQLALRLALDHPDKIRAVVILAGSTRFVPTNPEQARVPIPLDKRVQAIDTYMAPRWFRTVTRVTWDDNNFLPGDYAVNPVRGLRLWREAAEPLLHVWVRYLCEFYAQDISLEFDELAVPVLVLEPGLEGLYHDPGNDYMVSYCRRSWEGVEEMSDKIQVVRIPDSRACLWFDQPEQVHAAIAEFLKAGE